MGDSQEDLSLKAEVFSLFPYGIMVLDRDGVVLALNRQAEALLQRPAAGWWSGAVRCCQIFGCKGLRAPLRDVCLRDLARRSDRTLPELRLDLPGGEARSVWVTAAPLAPESNRVALQIRDADHQDRRRRTTPHWIGERQLRISAFGCTRVESREGRIGGAWLDQRPGQVLKYLVCHRHRAATSEEIAQAIWPKAGRAGLGSVRHAVHELRDHLEPDRRKRAPSSFVLSRQARYGLDPDRVQIDVSDFLEAVHAGTTAFAKHDQAAAKAHLERTINLYVGDLFAEDPYELWMIDERDRLRERATEALRLLVELAQREGNLDATHMYLKRLTEMDPFDVDLQRSLIQNCLRRGRRSEASRRFSTFRVRMLHEFGDELDFSLRDLHGA